VCSPSDHMLHLFTAKDLGMTISEMVLFHSRNRCKIFVWGLIGEHKLRNCLVYTMEPTTTQQISNHNR
jgi:hypothetical protein